MTEKILEALKPKIASLGFNKDEVKVLADTLVKKLTDEATDEEINAQIDAIVPILQLSQAQASRIITKEKEKLAKELKQKETETEEKQEPKAEPKAETKAKSDNETDKLLKSFMAKFEKYVADNDARFESLKQEKTAQTRKQRLDEILKDSGSFGTRTMRAYERMSFKDDDDFETFLEETKTDLQSWEKENQSNKLSISPLSVMNRVPDNVATDKEIEDLAKMF